MQDNKPYPTPKAEIRYNYQVVLDTILETANIKISSPRVLTKTELYYLETVSNEQKRMKRNTIETFPQREQAWWVYFRSEQGRAVRQVVDHSRITTKINRSKVELEREEGLDLC